MLRRKGTWAPWFLVIGNVLGCLTKCWQVHFAHGFGVRRNGRQFVRVLQSGDRFMSFVRPRTLLSIVSFIDYSIHCFLLLVNIIHSLAPPDRL